MKDNYSLLQIKSNDKDISLTMVDINTIIKSLAFKIGENQTLQSVIRKALNELKKAKKNGTNKKGGYNNGTHERTIK